MPRRLSRASVVRVFRPGLSVSSTGQSSHILIRCSTRRSTIRTVYRDRYPKASDTSSPPCLLRSLPAGAVAGWGLRPLEKRRLVTAHVDSGRSRFARSVTRIPQKQTSTRRRRGPRLGGGCYIIHSASVDLSGSIVTPRTTGISRKRGVEGGRGSGGEEAIDRQVGTASAVRSARQAQLRGRRLEFRDGPIRP
jgi:hypothetical protein